MTAEEIQECDAREQVTCSKSHTKNTKTTYMSYWNALRDWAALHIRACLDADGNFDVHRLREWIQNNLEQARTMFIRFLSQRKHRYKRYTQVWDLCVALSLFFIEEGDPQFTFGNV